MIRESSTIGGRSVVFSFEWSFVFQKRKGKSLLFTIIIRLQFSLNFHIFTDLTLTREMEQIKISNNINNCMIFYYKLFFLFKIKKNTRYFLLKFYFLFFIYIIFRQISIKIDTFKYFDIFVDFTFIILIIIPEKKNSFVTSKTYKVDISTYKPKIINFILLYFMGV